MDIKQTWQRAKRFGVSWSDFAELCRNPSALEIAEECALDARLPDEKLRVELHRRRNVDARADRMSA
jgi:hypothetical protein